MTPSNSNNQGLLSSWKEIAAYLDCDGRTCRRWEQNFGLPIHRMEGTAKSRVYAYKGELDAWRRERLSGVLKANGKDQAAQKQHSHNIPKQLFWLLPLLVVIIAAAIFLFRPSPGQPVDFRIKGSKLIILDGNGKELWDFDTGISNLAPEEVFRRRFQFKTYAPNETKLVLPMLVIKDINNDARSEVLFGTMPQVDTMAEGEVYCFSCRGKEYWHHKAGREVEFEGRTYSSNYRIAGIDLLDIDADSNQEILVFAIHNPHSPSQLLILNVNGEVIGDFINFGHLLDFLCCDIDSDGKKELLVAGLNDEYGKGCLIVFDPSRIGGCSPQIPEYAGSGVSPGSELFYVLFPRTDVDRALFPLKESIEEIRVLNNHRIQVRSGTTQLYFELDSDLRLHDVKGSDHFRLKHRELKAAGKISSVLDEAYYEELKKGVLYWDGEQWTSTPTMNKYWNNPR